MFDSVEFFIGVLFGLMFGVNLGIMIGKKQKPWSRMTPEERKEKKRLMIIAGVLVALGLVVFLLTARAA